MGNSDSKRLAMRAWLKQTGAHYGGLVLAAMFSVLFASPAQASKWPPVLSHPALDAASVLVLRASSALHADDPCSLEHGWPCTAGLGSSSSPEAATIQRKRAWHGEPRLALPGPNGLFEVDASPLLELANNGMASPVFSRVGALGREASRLADGGCDLGGGRSGLDSVLSSLIVLALAALGMRFRT